MFCIPRALCYIFIYCTVVHRTNRTLLGITRTEFIFKTTPILLIAEPTCVVIKEDTVTFHVTLCLAQNENFAMQMGNAVSMKFYVCIRASVRNSFCYLVTYLKLNFTEH